MYEYSVQFFPVSGKLPGEIADEFYKQCSYCDKQVLVDSQSILKMPRSMLSGDMSCRFCARRGMHAKRFFAFSTRSVVCQLSEILSSQQNNQLMYQCQLLDYVESHRASGLKNYCLDYDEESFNWFVDLGMVGDTDDRVSEREIHKSVVEMLACFNPTVFGIDLQPAFSQIRDRLSESVKSQEPRGSVFVPTFGGMRVSQSRASSFTISDIS